MSPADGERFTALLSASNEMLCKRKGHGCDETVQRLGRRYRCRGNLTVRSLQTQAQHTQRHSETDTDSQTRSCSHEVVGVYLQYRCTDHPSRPSRPQNSFSSANASSTSIITLHVLPHIQTAPCTTAKPRFALCTTSSSLFPVDDAHDRLRNDRGWQAQPPSPSPGQVEVYPFQLHCHASIVVSIAYEVLRC